MNRNQFIKTVHDSLLGDGYLFKVERDNPKVNTSFLFKQKAEHSDYFYWLVSVLEELTSVRVDEKSGGVCERGYNNSDMLILQTKRHPVYKQIYQRVYRNAGNTHVKTLDPHYIKNMDWQTWAMMYMDDGWLEVRRNKVKEDFVRCAISTHCFSYYENKKLRDILAGFGVHADVARQKKRSGVYQHYLRFSKDNAKRFIDGVEPYIFDSFRYKIDYGSV